jgi:hypothetical protein
MAHKTYQYCVAENWGKGFITHNDSRKIGFTGFPGNVWRVPAHNQDANRWIAGVNGTHKTLSEAQAIVDAEVQLKHKLIGMHYLQNKKHQLLVLKVLQDQQI